MSRIPCTPQYPIYPDHPLPLPDIKLSTRSLCSLTIVCKQWHTICTPRLYRCLAIVDSIAMGSLLHTLEHPQTTYSGRVTPLGCHTRHLIIALSDYPAHENGTNSERFENRVLRRFGNLGRLARCLPHLQTLSTSIYTQDMWGLPAPYYGKDFAAVVIQTSAQSLRKLHFHHYPFVLFSRQELRKLLESTPNLVAVTGAGVGSHIGCPASLPHLPHLKYLDVNSETGQCDLAEHETNRTPSLDHVLIRPSPYSNLWAHLLSSQGPKLTSISLDLRSSVDSENCSNCLSLIINLCHSLSRLEICIGSWHYFPRLDPLPPVEHLAISVQDSNIEVATICEKLATIRSPSLQAVRLIDAGMFEWFMSPLSNNVESAWRPLVGHSFRIVDYDGRELGPPGHSSPTHRPVAPCTSLCSYSPSFIG
ncbi:hypothetical protein F5148DRAFT_15869 [Russula earlei]|uniref:Uncharacterized protein n=1 Tax=Russula earlei TaxID=71964 RepID=A0ACC0UKW7_9AGAM|nr:hypothetical protein F5148DRAFT_15869 [Russula earlei]